MVTDNDTNFVGANNITKKEAKAALNAISTASEIKGKMCEWEIQWEFGPPEAFHHEGIYECQIRTIHQVSNALSGLSRRFPTDD